ncbi:hypothetical protein M5689_008634 [Euphorbia peplus]|nr:hypothetical protein M5689_008634 [Euphorbia peplus]
MSHLSTIPKPPNSTGDPNSTTAAADCLNCGTKDSYIIHNVRLRGIYRRLCTACVLRLHPGSFCPYCFTFYDSVLPPPSKRLPCSSCSSHTHTHCVPNHPPTAAFLCPPCADPGFNFVNLDRTKTRVIDKEMAGVLLCAAKIAACSMAKAEVVARGDAEKRVKEAAVCRKRAREALEHVALVARRMEGEGGEVSRSGSLVKRENEGLGSGMNVDRGEKGMSNGKVENGVKVEKNTISSHGSVTVKEEGRKP